jgi:preprotein translocase subunit SecA
MVSACIDTSWSQYLAEIADIREGIHLHRVGGQDPYVEFQKLVVVKFAELLPAVEERAIHIFAAMQVSGETLKNRDDQRLKTPSATMFGNIGVSTGAAVMWPLMVLSLLVNTIVSRLRRNTHHASKEKNMS